MPRSVLTYWNISDNGTNASTTLRPPGLSLKLLITPLLELRSPITSPKWSSGVTTSTFIIGSKILGPAFRIPSLKAPLAASWNARTLESTSWYEPSTKAARTSTTGKPASTPLHIDSSNPFITPGMNSLGTAPPFISLTNSYPLPASKGSKRIVISANCPCPPDCFL
uniref:Uncharacterized protein n=1 Tax=Opuntia streptacantha TaxID=393608 RepID=A0A7C9D2M3_OPUST